MVYGRELTHTHSHSHTLPHRLALAHSRGSLVKSFTVCGIASFVVRLESFSFGLPAPFKVRTSKSKVHQLDQATRVRYSSKAITRLAGDDSPRSTSSSLSSSQIPGPCGESLRSTSRSTSTFTLALIPSRESSQLSISQSYLAAPQALRASPPPIPCHRPRQHIY